ncbi:MAG: hypothetical protein AAF800_07665 [Planctomycetota bacterium]
MTTTREGVSVVQAKKRPLFETQRLTPHRPPGRLGQVGEQNGLTFGVEDEQLAVAVLVIRSLPRHPLRRLVRREVGVPVQAALPDGDQQTAPRVPTLHRPAVAR